MSLKRVIFYILAVIVCFLLQTSVFQYLKLADVMPNIMLILTVIIGFIRGPKEGIVIGFVCGLLIDLFFGDVVGQYALLYIVFGYVNGQLHRFFYEDELLLPILLLAGNTVAYSLLVFFFFFAMRGRLNLGAYFLSVILPETVYTGVVSLVVYKIISAVDIRITSSEKRSMF